MNKIETLVAGKYDWGFLLLHLNFASSDQYRNHWQASQGTSVSFLPDGDRFPDRTLKDVDYFFNFYFIFNILVYVSVWGYVYLNAGTHGVRRHWISLGLELWAIVSFLMWVLGTKLESSTRTVHALTDFSLFLFLLKKTVTSWKGCLLCFIIFVYL